jgi:hypothetical protein
VSRELYLQGMGGDRGDPALEALATTLDRENAALQERIVVLSAEVARLRAAELTAERADVDALRGRLEALAVQLEEVERARDEQRARAARAEDLLAVERRRADGLRATIRLIGRTAPRLSAADAPVRELAEERERHARTRRKLEHVTAHLTAIRSGRAYRLLRLIWRVRAAGRRRRP